MNRISRAAGAVIGLALLASCGTGGGTGTAAPTTVPVNDVRVEATVDWTARTLTISGLDGYELDFCEGEGPFLCVVRDGEWIGAIELGTWADDGGVLDDGPDAWVADFLSALEEDRRTGCHPDFQLAGVDAEPMPFGGATGFRYGFTGSIDGRPVERVVNHLVVIDGAVHVLSLNALADDGCLAREGELPLDAVDDLLPALAAIAAGTTSLPPVDTGPATPERPGAPSPTQPAASPGDGVRSGWLRGRSHEGFLDLDAAVMLSGQEAVEAARADGQLPPDGQLPNDFYIDDDEASITILPVSDRLVVELYDCTAGCELRAVDAQAFLRHQVQPYGGPEALVSVEVRGGAVVAVREIYVP
jgi:hypothetical protein